MIDTNTEFGERVQRRLTEETIGWLTTVTAGGQPQSVPVWFLWQEDETLLLYSQPDTPKLRNIKNNPHVSFNLDSDGRGGNIVRLEGPAAIAEDAPPATDVPAYLEKYNQGIASLGLTPQGFAEGYSVAVKIRPSKVRGH